MNILYADDRPIAVEYGLDEMVSAMVNANGKSGENCRNCGAPVEPFRACAYCGTPFYVSEVSFGRTVNGKLIRR